MKVSFTTFACPDWTLQKIIDEAHRIGYDGVEIRCDAQHQHGLETYTSKDGLKKANSLFQGAEIHPCCLGTSLQCVSESLVEQIEQRIELAVSIGCPAIRVFAGQTENHLHTHQLIEQAGQHLAQVGHYADDAGVEIWLETHDSASLAATAAAIVRRANQRMLGIVYDNLHPYRKGEELEATIASLGNMTRHVHFHDGMRDPQKVLICPFGQGELPLDDMFRALVNMGFDGYISGEWFYDSYGDDPELALEKYHKELTDLAQRHGIHLGKNR